MSVIAENSLTSEQRSKLITAALEAREMAYNPYSKFRVGAALLSSAGDIIKGSNVENASYGGTICAERVALVKAVSDGIKNFAAMAVISDVLAAISPCGICRQFIREFCDLKMPILLVHGDWGPGNDEGVKIMTLAELLPHSFGPEDLDKPRI